MSARKIISAIVKTSSGSIESIYDRDGFQVSQIDRTAHKQTVYIANEVGQLGMKIDQSGVKLETPN